MAVVYHEIYLPIDTESTFDYIVIKQGDAGTHRVRATLISNNRVYTIPTSGASYFMKFRKPDNNYCLVEATVSDNTISAEVTEEMLRVSGTGRGEFMIVSGSNELKTATFHVKIVKETFTSGDVQSHSDFAPFAALLQGAGAAASNANTAAAAANAAASLAEQKAQAIPDDYSDLVAEVAGKADQSNTYTKDQVDGLIEDVTVETDTTLAVSGAPADAAETGRQFGLINESLGEYSAIKPIVSIFTPNVIPDSNRVGEHTSNGVTFVVSDDGKTVQASGTSTASATAKFSFQIIKGSTSTYPSILKKGKTYKMKFDSTDSGIFANIWIKRDDDTTTSIVNNSGELVFSIPDDAKALAIRVLVNRQTTVDGALTNIRFDEVISVELSASGDASDRTAEILARLESFGYCHLGTGVFVVKNLQMPEGSTLEGCGKGTIVRLSTDTDAKYAVATNTDTSVMNLCIEGAAEDITLVDDITIERHAIYHVANYGYDSGDNTTKWHVQLSGLKIRRFSGAGIYQFHTGTPVDSGLVVTNCRIRNCNLGIYIESSSEYNKYVGVDITRCYYGFFNQGSSNVFDGGSISSCYVGFKLVDYGDDITDNIGHNIISNTTLNHFYASDGTVNGGICIEIRAGKSVTFDGCNMAFGSVDLRGVQGVIFNSCQFGNRIPMNITNGKLILYTGNVSRATGEPVFTITGSPNLICHNNYSRSGNPWEQNT